MFNKITFLGAGQMAEAILAGLVKNEGLIKKENIYVTNGQNDVRLKELEATYGITTTRDQEALFKDTEMIVLFMKPKDVEEALKEVRDHIHEEQLVVSVLAGVEAAKLEEYLGKDIPVVRTMPNTSAMVGASATGISKGTFATDLHLEQTAQLFETIGKNFIIPESDMHGLTSISGSGPAYFYYMVQALEKAALEVGLSSTLARELAVQTFEGAGKMLAETGENPMDLRKNITSPNGTTEAGIASLTKDDFSQIIENCVKSARDRSIEMSKE